MFFDISGIEKQKLGFEGIDYLILESHHPKPLHVALKLLDDLNLPSYDLILTFDNPIFLHSGPLRLSLMKFLKLCIKCF